MREREGEKQGKSNKNKNKNKNEENYNWLIKMSKRLANAEDEAEENEARKIERGGRGRD